MRLLCFINVFFRLKSFFSSSSFLLAMFSITYSNSSNGIGKRFRTLSEAMIEKKLFKISFDVDLGTKPAKVKILIKSLKMAETDNHTQGVLLLYPGPVIEILRGYCV